MHLPSCFFWRCFASRMLAQILFSFLDLMLYYDYISYAHTCLYTQAHPHPHNINTYTQKEYFSKHLPHWGKKTTLRARLKRQANIQEFTQCCRKRSEASRLHMPRVLLLLFRNPNQAGGLILELFMPIIIHISWYVFFIHLLSIYSFYPHIY